MKKSITYLLSTGCIVAAAMGAMAVSASADVTTNVSVVTGKDSEGNDIESSSFKTLDEACKALSKVTEDVVITLDKSYSLTQKLPSKAPNVTLTTNASGVTLTASKGLAAKGNLEIANMTVSGSKIDVKGNLQLTGTAKFGALDSIKGGKGESSTLTISTDQFIAADISGFGKIDVQSGKTLSLLGKKKMATGELAVSGNVNIFGTPLTVDSITGSGSIYYVTLKTSDSKTVVDPSFITIKKQVTEAPSVKLGYKVSTAVKPAAPTEAEIATLNGANDVAFPTGTKVLVVGKASEDGAAAGYSLIKQGNGSGNDGLTDKTYNYTFSVEKKKTVYVRPAVYSFNDGSTTTPIATWTEVTDKIAAASTADATYTVTLLANTDAEKIKMPKKGTYAGITISSGLTGSTITSGSLAKAVKNASGTVNSFDKVFKKGDAFYIGVEGDAQSEVSTFTGKEIVYTEPTITVAGSTSSVDNTGDSYVEKALASASDIDATAGNYAAAIDAIMSVDGYSGAEYNMIATDGADYYAVVKNGQSRTFYKLSNYVAGSYGRTSGDAAVVDVSSGTEITSSATGTDKLYYDGANVQSGEKVYKVSDKYYVGTIETVTPVLYNVYPVTNGTAAVEGESAGTATAVGATAGTITMTGTAISATTISETQVSALSSVDAPTTGWYFSETPRAQLAFQGGLSATGNLTLENIELFGYKAIKNKDKSITKDAVATSISGGKNNVTLDNVALYRDVDNTGKVKDETTLKSVTAAALTLKSEQEVKAEKVSGTKLVIPSGDTATIVTASLAFKGDKNADDKRGIDAPAESLTLNIVDKKSGAVLTDAKKAKATIEGYKNEAAPLTVSGKQYLWGYNGKNVVPLGGADTAKNEVVASKVYYAEKTGDTATITFNDLKSFSTYLTNEKKAGRLDGSESWTIAIPAKITKLELPKAQTYDTLTIKGQDAVFNSTATTQILDLGTLKSLKLTGNLIIDSNAYLKVTKLTKGSFEYTCKLAVAANKAYVQAVDALVTALKGSGAAVAVDTNYATATDALKTAITTAAASTYLEKTSEEDIEGTTLGNPKDAAEAYANISAALKFYGDNSTMIAKMGTDSADSQSADAKKVFDAYEKLSDEVKALFANEATKVDVAAVEDDPTTTDVDETAAAHTWYKWAAKSAS